MALLEVAHLSKSYRRSGAALAQARVVDDVSFTLTRGETLGLVGESGSGKSTIARMVLGLIEPSAGSVLFDGAPITGSSSRALRSMRRRMQPVFQDPFAALNPRMRVANILAEPFLIHKHATGRSRQSLRAASAELLRTVGLDESALPRYPHEFSGGQRQRINIARALALRPELLVLDEPVSALDVSVGAQVMNLLRSLQREFSLTYLFISHSMPLVRYLATDIAVLQGGRLVELGSCEQVTQAPHHPYTQTLMAATPQLRTS
ncbi:MAG TPA: ATP-binding cassette domain-containing protein [Acidobacteriaceae bacterium]